MPARAPRSLAMAIPPLRTTASATAEPMPPAAPVMRMTLSRKRPIKCSWCYRAPSISNVTECAMAAFAGRKARSAGRTFALHHGGRASPFGLEPIHLGESFLQIDRAAIGAHAALRKPGDLMRERLSRGAALAIRHHTLAQTDTMAFIRHHLASCEDEIQRGAASDNARQPHGAPIDQRHAPAPAIHAHVGALFHHAQVAPQRQLHAARDRRAGNCGDHGFGELQPRRSHRPARDRSLTRRKIQRRHWILLAQLRSRVFQIEPRTKRAARAPQHCYRLRLVAIEREQGFGQRVGTRRVHRVARLDSAANDRCHGAIAFDAEGHETLLWGRGAGTNFGWRNLGQAFGSAQVCEDIMRRSRGSFFDLAMDGAMAATAMSMTLWHRLPMFGIASLATAAQRQAEATRMVDEKTAAFIEGCVAANIEAARMFGAAATGQIAPIANGPLAIASAGLKPAFRTVNANAKRLNRRAIRNTFGG